MSRQKAPAAAEAQADDDDNIVEAVCAAVTSRAPEKVVSLLDCNDTSLSSFDQSLISSTPAARVLLGGLVDALGKQAQDDEAPPGNIRSMLRALLMVPPSYETPWITCCQFITNASQKESKIPQHELMICLSEIKCFLNEASLPWRNKSNRNSITSKSASKASNQRPSAVNLASLDSKFWTSRLVQVILSDAIQICADKANDKISDLRPFFFDIVTSILSISQDLDDSLFSSVLDTIINHKRKSRDLLWWLALMIDCRSFLRPHDGKTIRHAITDTLTASFSKEFCTKEQADVIGQIMIFCSDTCSNIYQDSELVEWQKVLCGVMEDVYFGGHPADLLESQMCNHIRLLRDTGQNKWIAGLNSSDILKCTKEWVVINMMMITYQALKQGGVARPEIIMGPCLSSKCESIREESDDLGYKIQNMMVRRLIAHDAVTAFLSHAHSLESIIATAGELSYAGRGRFLRNGKTTKNSFTDAGVQLYDCVSGHKLDSDTHETTMKKESKRATWWFDFVVDLAKGSERKGSVDNGTTAVCLAASTVIYFEFPSLRKPIIEIYIQSLKSLQNSVLSALSHEAAVACAALVLLSKSVDNSTIDNHDATIAVTLRPVGKLLMDLLPLPIFSPLCSAIHHLDFGKTDILTASLKYIETTTMHSWGYRRDSISEQRQRSSIVGLLELLCGDDWDDIEIEAWRVLSDAIVLDQPFYDVSSKAFLYQLVEKFISSKKASAMFAEHLLRALTVRLFLLIRKDPGSSAHFSLDGTQLSRTKHKPMKSGQGKEDVISMLRLLVHLLEYSSNVNAGEKRDLLLQDSFELLVEFTLTYDQNPLNAHCILHDECCDYFKEGSDDFELNTAIAIRLLSYVSEYVLRIKPVPSSKDSNNTDSAAFIDLQKATMDLVRREHEKLCSYSLHNDTHEVLPQWVSEAPQIVNSVNETSKMNNIETGSCYSTVETRLCDFLVEIMFCRRIVASSSISLADQEKGERLLLGAARVFECRKEAQAETDIIMDRVSVEATASDLFSLAADTVKGAILHSWALEETDRVVAAMVEYCRGFNLCLEELRESTDYMQRAPNASLLLKSLLVLYQSVADEDASIRFITYLEGKCLTKRKTSSRKSTDRALYTLRGIRTNDDVDVAVRGIRFQVLRALSICSRISLDLVTKSKTILPPAWSSELQVKIPPETLMTALSVLSSDLLRGLDGKSGAITSEMYLEYLNAIENTAVLLQQHVLRLTDTLTTTSVFETCADVLETIMNILISYPLQDRDIFQKSLYLCTSLLPQVCRQINRICHIESAALPMKQKKVHRIVENLLFCTFSNWATILERWSSLKDPDAAAWEDIVGPEHISFPDDDSNEDASAGNSSSRKGSRYRKSLADRDAAPPTDIVLNGENDSMSSRVGNSIVLKLSSKETWNWTFQSLILSYTELWSESRRMSYPKATGDLNLNETTEYISQRRFLLSRSLDMICLLFSSPDRLDVYDGNGRTTGSTIEVFGMYLPNRFKIALLETIQCIIKIMTHSINTLTKYLKVDTSDQCSSKWELAECVSCLASWLCSSPVETDFVAGTVTWINLERRKSSQTSKRNPKDNELQNDYLATLNEVDKFDVSFQNFYGLLGDTLKIKNSPAMQRRVRALDALFLGDGNKNFELRNYCKTKVQVLDENIPSGVQLPLDIASASIAQSSDTTSVGTKRSTSKAAPTGEKRSPNPKRRKRTSKPNMRSRNPVIDKWLKVDQGSAAEKDDGIASGDAYVDLEDFLVDG